jgi:phosphoesterase RecJ-like protein
MIGTALEFLSRHSSLIITTHDPSDPDGLGAEKVLYLIAKKMGKEARIVNSSPVQESFRFMDTSKTIENWKNLTKPLSGEVGLIILDTSDEYNIGELRNIIPFVQETYVIDHHEPNTFCAFKGCIDNSASSVCELAVELAQSAGITLDAEHARAAYAGIVYDTGFFAYPKTTARTFRAALALVEAGVNPYEIYRELNENTSIGTLLLEKRALASLEFHHQNRVAVQILRKSDLEATSANYEDTKNFINTPMSSRSIEVSIILKECKEGQIMCSLRSKGKVNVSKLAQTMGGGGHVTAAGFKTSLGIDEALDIILKKVSLALEEK